MVHMHYILHLAEQIHNFQTHLQPNLDFLGQRPLREGSLNQWHTPAAQSPTLWSHLMGLLSDPRHHGKVLWEVFGDDAADSFLL